MKKLIKKQIDILEKKGYKFIINKKEIFKRYNRLYFSFNIKDGVTLKQVIKDMQEIENVWFQVLDIDNKFNTQETERLDICIRL